jgi:hypothetical protein
VSDQAEKAETALDPDMEAAEPDLDRRKPISVIGVRLPVVTHRNRHRCVLSRAAAVSALGRPVERRRQTTLGMLVVDPARWAWSATPPRHSGGCSLGSRDHRGGVTDRVRRLAARPHAGRMAALGTLAAYFRPVTRRATSDALSFARVATLGHLALTTPSSYCRS